MKSEFSFTSETLFLITTLKQKKEEKIAEENGGLVRVGVELTTLAFGRHQFEPKRDVTTRRDPPLSFFGEICVDSQRVESAD